MLQSNQEHTTSYSGAKESISINSTPCITVQANGKIMDVGFDSNALFSKPATTIIGQNLANYLAMEPSALKSTLSRVQKGMVIMTELIFMSGSGYSRHIRAILAPEATRDGDYIQLYFNTF